MIDNNPCLSFRFNGDILDLAKRILRMTGSRSRIVYGELPKDDPQIRRPDITVAMQKLQWAPKVSLAHGLGQTIAYFRGELDSGCFEGAAE